MWKQLASQSQRLTFDNNEQRLLLLDGYNKLNVTSSFVGISSTVCLMALMPASSLDDACRRVNWVSYSEKVGSDTEGICKTSSFGSRLDGAGDLAGAWSTSIDD